MSFLNTILLGGIAALAIPLLIHIFNKRRFRTVHWGAMHLLAPILKKNNRRIRIEELLLLLLRIAIPVLLALCLARPVLTGVKKFEGDEKTSTVFVLDDSFSMQDGTAARSNFSRARDEVIATIKALRDGSDASVLLMGGSPQGLAPEPTHDLEDLTADLRGAAGDAGPAAVAAGVLSARAEFDKMSHGAREVVFVSDFQRRDWEGSAAAARRGALDALNEMPISPNLTLFHIGGGSGENVAVEKVEVSSLVLGVGQKFTLRADLANHGDSAHPDLMVFFEVDGEEKRSSQVSLAAGGRAQVLFTHTFDTPGSHFVEVSTDADALKGDNRFAAAFTVWDRVPVLLVDGAPSDRPMAGETDFLQIALQPFRSANPSLNDLVSSTVVRPDALREEHLNGASVVVLANVPRLHGHQIEWLGRFVETGGGLLVFPGDAIDTGWYNNEFFAAAKGLLPRQYTDLAAPGQSSPARLVDRSFDHPALAFFNDPRNGALSGAEFTSHYRIGLAPDMREAAAAAVAPTAPLRFDSGDPFFVERPHGEGRVLQFAAPADADWSNLPTQPTFLPLAQRLVTYLASRVEPPRNVSTGEKLVALLPPELIGGEAVFEDPAGSRHTVPVRAVGPRASAEFAGTRKPGIYTLVPPGDGAARQHFAVNLDRAESDLEALTEKEVRVLSNDMGASYVTSFDEYQNLDRERRYGIEFWRPLLIALVAFLFLELLYQQWIGRTRPART